jgi:hypothetical protein
LLATAALALGASPVSAEPRAGNTLANGGFAHGLHGWKTGGARLALVRRGVVGRGARVRSTRRRGAFFVYLRSRPVASTAAGAVYEARAWVRSARPGRRVCLRVRELASSRALRVGRACARSRRWRRLRTILRADCAGAQVGLSVFSRGRTSFYLDEVSLKQVRAAAAPGVACTSESKQNPAPPAPPPPPPTPPPGQSFLNPFPAGSIWNSPLPSDVQVDSASADKVSYWLSQVRYPNMVLNAYGTAIAVATPDSPTYTISCTVYACPNMNQYGAVPIPAGTKPDPSSDGHLAVWDPATHREWDFWISKCADDCAHTASGGSFSTESLSPSVPYAANAANWPLLAGLVHPDEIAAGHIDHPLIFSTPNVGTGYVCPAVHSDGKNTDSRALREGSLLQLDPSLNVDSLSIPDWQKTIARALQRYGMYLADGGGTLAIDAENPINRGDLWGRLGLTGNSALFSAAFPWGRMRVLTPPKPWC